MPAPDHAARLDRVQLRIARRVAERLAGGGLIFAIGSDERRRRAFEAALSDAGLVVAHGSLSATGDPWAQILALARTDATPCVCWTESAATELIRSLNRGHERLSELPSGLLVWIGGLEAIETSPVQAPDLWAHRASVEWIVSVLDFQARLPAGLPAAPSARERLARAQQLLAQLPADRPERIDALIESMDAAIDLDDPAQASERYAEAEQICAVMGTANQRRLLLCARVSLAVQLGRQSEVQRLLEAEAPWTDRPTDATQLAPLLHAASVQVQAGHFARADAMVMLALRSSTLATNQSQAWHRLHALSIAARSAITRGRVDDARRQIAKFVEHAPPMAGLGWVHAEQARFALAIALLRPFEALCHAFRCRALLVHFREIELAIDQAEPIVDGLLALGLSADAYAVVDAMLAISPRSPSRRLSLAVMQARTLIACGAAALGVEQLWAALDGYRSALTSAHPLTVAPLTIAATQLILRDLLFLAGTPAQSAELCELGLSLAVAAEQTTIDHGQPDWAFELRAKQARLLVALGRHGDARTRLEQNLEWSQRHHGPMRICHGHLELARLDTARGQPSRAMIEIDRARHALALDSARLQPLASWRELLLEHARVLAASGQAEQARAEALEARDRMRAAGLPGEELQVLHVLAEPIAGEGRDVLPEREQAATLALALASHSGLVEEEARALANLAWIHAEQGRRAPAKAMIGEARWLLEDRLYGRIREHVDSIGARIDDILQSDA